MKKLFLGAALAASMLVAAPAAFAATVIPTPLPAAAPDGSISAHFGQSSISGGIFETIFTFTFPTSGLTSVGLISVKSSASTDVNFTKVTLNGIDFAITNGAIDIATLEDFPVLSGLQELYVKGTSGGNGSYGVDLTFSPGAVPEPATWAMMIIGFSGAGVAIRRRRRDTSAALA